MTEPQDIPTFDIRWRRKRKEDIGDRETVAKGTQERLK